MPESNAVKLGMYFRTPELISADHFFIPAFSNTNITASQIPQAEP
jgi:hypothetical protein